MRLEIVKFGSRDEWLTGREQIKGIGGSDAAAAVGLSRRKSMVQLWKEKTGRAAARDLSKVEYVQMGVKTEGPMRELFAALHPELEITHRPFDIYRQKERPWLFATLDGEIRDRATGDMGVLEIKKADVMNKRDREEWDGRVPDEYFIQVLHQMLATGYSFAYLWALQRHGDGSCTLREYYFPSEDYEGDLAWLAKEEDTFMGYLRSGRVPPATLTMP
ncbi:MAG: lambda-exonuclease family protein [bacterium]